MYLPPPSNETKWGARILGFAWPVGIFHLTTTDVVQMHYPLIQLGCALPCHVHARAMEEIAPRVHVTPPAVGGIWSSAISSASASRKGGKGADGVVDCKGRERVDELHNILGCHVNMNSCGLSAC